MKVKLSYVYHEDNVIPPKCSKPRTIYGLKGESNVTIKQTNFDKLEHVCRTLHRDFNNDLTRTAIDYFFYEGKLYTRAYKGVTDQPDIPMGITELLEDSERFHWNHTDTLQNRRNSARRWAQRWLIVDGEYVYQTTGEPRWVIHTFGLGSNHGGSSLSLTEYYNRNIGKSRYFRLDQKELATATFERIALGRGDTKSVPKSFEYEDAVIYRPDLLKLDPNKEHGDGDPFINGIENMISAVKDPLVSGLMVMSKTASLLKK